MTDIALRKQKIRERKCCFKCLRPKHVAKFCRNKVFCYRCKAQNKHHTAICEEVIEESGSHVMQSEEVIEESGTHVMKSDRSVILQSAKAYATDEKETILENVKVLLDSCSQQTFVTEKVVKTLGLKPIGSKLRKINAFGTEEGKYMNLKEYVLVLKPLNKESSIYVNALAVPKICAPIVYGKIGNLVFKQNEFLRTLNLADNMMDVSGTIDVLIGADFYWAIVSGNLKRNSRTGLVAISSSLGWLIIGPVIKNHKI